MRTTFLSVFTSAVILALVALHSGCSSTPSPGAGRPSGPDGTVAYEVPVDANEPGVEIEVNGQTAGVTPMVLTIYGDRDGTFHNFGSYDFIIRALPPGPNRRSMVKAFRTGALMAKEDKIPERIYFEFPTTQIPSN